MLIVFNLFLNTYYYFASLYKRDSTKIKLYLKGR